MAGGRSLTQVLAFIASTKILQKKPIMKWNKSFPFLVQMTLLTLSQSSVEAATCLKEIYLVIFFN